MSAPNLEQLARADARARIERAMVLIERAQNDLASACAELSAIQGGFPVWRATSKLHDRVKAQWYRVQAFLHRGAFQLDQVNTEALERRHRPEARP